MDRSQWWCIVNCNTLKNGVPVLISMLQLEHLLACTKMEALKTFFYLCSVYMEKEAQMYPPLAWHIHTKLPRTTNLLLSAIGKQYIGYAHITRLKKFKFLFRFLVCADRRTWIRFQIFFLSWLVPLMDDTHIFPELLIKGRTKKSLAMTIALSPLKRHDSCEVNNSVTNT